MTTYGPRPLRRSEGADAGLLVGAPVQAATSWSEFALNANLIRGKGASLVPFYSPTITVASGATRTFRFRVKTRNVAIARVWSFLFRRDSEPAAVTATIRAPASTGTSIAYPAGFGRWLLQPVTYIEPVASKATAEVEITFDITAAGGDISLDGISCYEQDRAGLADDTTDFGVMIDTVRSGQPILAAENQSVYGVMRALANLDARRTGIYQWAYPTEAPITRTSSVALAVLELGCPVQVPKLNIGATTGAVKWSVYGKVAAGAGGTVAITTSGSGVTDSVVVSGTSYAWSTARSVSIACDDFGQADGRQGGAWDDLTWTLKGDNTNLFSVAVLSVWHDDGA